MGIIRPKGKSSNETSNYYGICDIAVLSFRDKSENFDWADVYLEVEVQQKGSDYTKTIRLAGSLDRDPDGSVTGGSVLNRLYHFFDVLGVRAGINAKGAFETEDGQPIENISKYLTENHACGTEEPTTFPYLAYVYKEKPKQPGGKVYTRVHHKINVNSEEGRRKLTEDVTWFKSKGFIKEAAPEQPKSTAAEVEEIFGSDALGNM